MIVVIASAVSFILGFGIGQCLASWHYSKRECRECLRRKVRYGFHSDGKEYKAVEVK